MEDWEIDFEWLKVRHQVKDAMGKSDLPDLRSILFLIGIQELGQIHREFTKEEKQDLMHIAVCTLLEEDDYYEFIGRDEDGWPHWRSLGKAPEKGIDVQEKLLKSKIINYFSSAKLN